ncbi:MAG: endo alpha-1,4 polygalactosaminidase [Actinomycetota bacterium]
MALPIAVLLALVPAAPAAARHHPAVTVSAAAFPNPVSTIPAGSLPDPVPCPDCWVPEVQTSWQWQLQGRIDTSIDAQMFDVDAFEVSARVVRRLHREGRAVVCYVSAGSWEQWRPDADRFPDSVLGNELDGWPGERWLDVRRIRLLAPIMKARMDRCTRKGFDGIEFDNVDGYQNDTGFELTAAHQLRYNVWLANQAHRRGLSVALKNDLEQVEDLLPYFDYALNEECFTYDECDLLTPFVDAGKAVFGVEYDLAKDEFCPQANEMDFNFLKKRSSLGVWRIPCR